jgi:hypothetical protein
LGRAFICADLRVGLLAGAGVHPDQALVDQSLPVGGDPPGGFVGHGDVPGTAADVEPLRPRLPRVCGEDREPVGLEQREPLLCILLPHLAGDVRHLRPGPRHGEPELLEQVLAVVHDHRLDIERHAEDLVVERGELERLRQDLRAQPVAHQRREVRGDAVDGEPGQLRVLDGAHVRGVARAGGIAELGVPALVTAGDLLEEDLDPVLALVERVHHRLAAAQRRPEGDLRGSARGGGRTRGTRAQDGQC